jgi:SAM-dependent methyltransferase
MTNKMEDNTTQVIDETNGSDGDGGGDKHDATLILKSKSSTTEALPTATPAYGSQEYWEQRYRKHYDDKQKNENDEGGKTAVGASCSKKRRLDVDIAEKVNVKAEDDTQEAHADEDEDGAAGHEWYFTYEELRPLLMPAMEKQLQQLADHDENQKDSNDANKSSTNNITNTKKLSPFTVLEIGCGDRPLAEAFAADIAAMRNNDSNNNTQEEKKEVGDDMNVVKCFCTDYSPSVIEYLQRNSKNTHSDVEPQNQQQHSNVNLDVQYQVMDATRLPFDAQSIDVVMEKGTLDAALSDKNEEAGVNMCRAIVAEGARVLNEDGCLIVISHMNAHNDAGMAWLEHVLVGGLQQFDDQCKQEKTNTNSDIIVSAAEPNGNCNDADPLVIVPDALVGYDWEIEIHGNSGPGGGGGEDDNNEDENESGAEEKSNGDGSDGDGDEAVMGTSDAEQEEGSNDEGDDDNDSDEEPNDSGKLGPAVYILWKRKRNSHDIDDDDDDDAASAALEPEEGHDKSTMPNMNTANDNEEDDQIAGQGRTEEENGSSTEGNENGEEEEVEHEGGDFLLDRVSLEFFSY